MHVGFLPGLLTRFARSLEAGGSASNRLNRRLESRLSPGAAAAVSILVVGLPVLVLVAAVLVVGLTELAHTGALERVGTALRP